MKKLITPKSEKAILRTHPIFSNIKGWFVKVNETSQGSFLVEAIDFYGRTFSKRGSDPNILQREIEDLIRKI